MVKHGGRRHGIQPAGRSQRLSVPISPADAAHLAELARAWGCSQAEVVRRLIRTTATK